MDKEYSSLIPKPPDLKSTKRKYELGVGGGEGESGLEQGRKRQAIIHLYSQISLDLKSTKGKYELWVRGGGGGGGGG